jgi:hypothetical protein
VRENVAVVILTSETCDSSSNEETELLEALDGKYDALRDKLLALNFNKEFTSRRIIIST